MKVITVIDDAVFTEMMVVAWIVALVAAWEIADVAGVERPSEELVSPLDVLRVFDNFRDIAPCMTPPPRFLPSVFRGAVPRRKQPDIYCDA